MCGNYSCSKNTLVIINVCYMIVSFILMGAAVKEKASGVVVSLPIIGGITACGIFLLLISIWGLVATMRHHQVMLFVYMLILFLIFIIQFSVSCAALGVSKQTEKGLVEDGWNWFMEHEKETIFDAENTFDCCGLNNVNAGYNCEKIPCSVAQGGNFTSCPTCMDKIEDKLDEAFSYVGGLGLFFSLVELIGGFVACRYRNLVDPINSGISASAAGGAGNI
uniref:Putative tetraspanin-31 n=1 Tax=Acartia pacifica TaxID=335913 RepID=A0A0U2VBY5_ACAPC|nr:putative tetraspanin-31 [Acartia pacifica]